MLKVFRPHQKLMFKYCMRVIHPFLAVKQRLGKTLVCIRRCKLYSNTHHILVCAPYEATLAWEDELMSEGQGKLIEVSGPSKDRLKLTVDHWDTHKWFFVSKEGHKWCPEVLLLKWDVVIVDEGTFIKEPNTAVTKFFLKFFRDVPHRWDLTGTPDPKGPMNYYTQLKFLDSSYLHQYKNFWDFRNKAFKLESSRSYKYVLTHQGKKNLTECLNANVFFMDRKEAGIKESRVNQARYISMPKKIESIYNKIEKEFALDILHHGEPIALTDDSEKLTKWATAKHQWLNDICNGFIGEEFVWDAKLKELKYLLGTELKGEKIIINATRVKYLTMLRHELGKDYSCRLAFGETTSKARKQIFRDFQQGKFQILIIKPAIAQFSLDFSIAETMIHYDSCPMLTRLQVEERLFKVGLNNDLLYLDLIIRDTVEQGFYENRLDTEDDMYMLRLYTKRLKEKYKI